MDSARQADSVHRLGQITADRLIAPDRQNAFAIHPFVTLAALGVAEMHDAAAELDLEGMFLPHELPGRAVASPIVRLLDLLAVVETLAEHAVIVADAVAPAGDADGGQ